MEETNQPKHKAEEKKKKKGLIFFLIFLIAGLSIFSAYTGYKAFVEGPNEMDSVKVERDTEKTRADKLQGEIDKAEEMLKELGFEDVSDMNTLKDQHLALKMEAQDQRDKIQKLKSKIDELLSLSDGQAKDLDSFKDLYRKLKSEVWQLKSQIRDLKKRNQELAQENNRLKEEKDKIDKELSEQKKSNEALYSKANTLQQKVKLGARLQTYDVIAEGVKVRRNGSESATARAKRAEKIRVAFTISKNELTNPGMKKVYLKVIGPNKQTLTDGGSNFDLEGKSTAYTSMDEIDYQNTKTDMVMYAKNVLSEGFQPGDYQIEIFCDGAKIGETTFDLK